MNKTFSLFARSLCSLYVRIGHAVEFLLQKIIELTPMRFGYCEAEVRSSSVSVVYVVRLRIVFLKAALQKRGSMGPMEPPLDPPLIAVQLENDTSR